MSDKEITPGQDKWDKQCEERALTEEEKEGLVDVLIGQMLLRTTRTTTLSTWNAIAFGTLHHMIDGLVVGVGPPARQLFLQGEAAVFRPASAGCLSPAPPSAVA